jgi:type IV secretory pathway VirJ component
MDAKETLELLEGHPLTKKIRAECEEEILQTRKEAAARIAAIRKESEEILPTLQDAEEQTRAALAEHDERRKILRSTLTAAAMALSTERQSRWAASVCFARQP